MANKTQKTVGETTNLKKGGSQMDSLKKLQMYYNNRQEYNKTHDKNYFMLNNTQLEQLRAHMNPEQLKMLDKAFSIIEDFNTMIYKALAKQYYLNKAYGFDTVHPSELQPKEISNVEQQSKAMRETQAKATKKTNKTITKELNKELEKGEE